MLSNPFGLLRSAWQSTQKFPVQSTLSILSIAVGACAIILVANLSASMQKSIATFEARENSQSVLIRADATFDEILTGTGAAITLEHGTVIKRTFAAIGQVTPVFTLGARSRKITIAQTEFDSHVFGTTANWAITTGNDMAKGRFIAVADELNRQDVCVVGFAYHNLPSILGTTVRIGEYRCRVIGVLARRGQLLVNHDEVVILPLSAAEDLARQNEESDTELIVSPAKGSTLEGIMPQLRSKMRSLLARTPAQADGFLLVDAQGVRQFIGESLGKASLVLSGMIAISMLVAGLGIFGLMLTGVVTRTSEIGIRRAVGATAQDIARQFLAESVLIALFGGFFGIIFSIIITLAIPFFSDVLTEVVISWRAMGVAVLCSGLTGVIFGFWPALRAAGLDPVVALGYE